MAEEQQQGELQKFVFALDDADEVIEGSVEMTEEKPFLSDFIEVKEENCEPIATPKCRTLNLPHPSSSQGFNLGESHRDSLDGPSADLFVARPRDGCVSLSSQRATLNEAKSLTLGGPTATGRIPVVEQSIGVNLPPRDYFAHLPGGN